MEAVAGSQLDVSYAQSFFSNRNRLGGLCPSESRYTTKDGRQTFVSSDTFGCKYAKIRCSAGNVRLWGVQFIDRTYPFDVVGQFRCDDPLLNRIWQLGVNTIRTCSEDAYVDCATRERVEWLADAVTIAYPISRATMAGPAVDGKPAWSDPRLFGNLLRHMGQSLQPDGRIKAHHPSDRWDIHGFIEDYSCLWIQGLRTWHDNTNDIGLPREMWPAVRAQLQWSLDRRTERGLVKGREFVYPGNPLCYKVCEGATLNAFLVKTFDDASRLARLLGDHDRERQYAMMSKAFVDAINTHLWDEELRTYSGGILDGTRSPATVHAAGCCLFFDAVPTGRRKSVETWFLKNLLKEKAMPYQYAYYFEVLARMRSAEADDLALQLMRTRWAAMADFETQTTFEDFRPGENCHEAGGAPTVYLSRHVLGVNVDGPSSGRRLLIEPHLGNLGMAEGIVVTEFGPVPIRWDRSKENGELRFAVEIPRKVTVEIAFPLAKKPRRVVLDGRDASVTSGAHANTFEFGPGKHEGLLQYR
jgi:hypothetical protein